MASSVGMTENTPEVPSVLTSDQRKQALAQMVAQEVAHGKRVESHTDYQAVLVTGKPVNHILHLILTLLTCGAWGLVWLILAFAAGEKRTVVAVDDWGNIQRR